MDLLFREMHMQSSLGRFTGPPEDTAALKEVDGSEWG